MKTTKILLSIFVLMASSIRSPLFAENAVMPSEFLNKAFAIDMSEIETGKLALLESSSPEVIFFAQHMILEHISNSKELLDLAMQKDISMGDATRLVINIKAFAERQIDQTSFDTSYATNQVASHKRAVQLFRHAVASDDSEVSAFAKVMLPKLLHHLYMAQKLVEITSNDSVANTNIE